MTQIQARPEVERLSKLIRALGASDPERTKAACKTLIALGPGRNRIERSLSYYALAMGYAYAFEIEKALRYAKLALSEAKKTDDDSLREQALQAFGIIYERKSDYERALEYSTAAADLARKLGDKIRLAMDLGGMCRHAHKLQRYQLAFESVLESKTIYAALGDTANVAKSSGNLGVVLKDVALYDEAIAAFQDELEIIQSVGDKKAIAGWKTIAGCLSNIGEVYALKALYKEAYDYFRQAYTVVNETNEVDFRWVILGNFAQTCLELDLLDEAEGYLNEKDKIAGHLLPSQAILETGILRGEIQLKRGDGTRAMETLLEVEQHFEKSEEGTKHGYADIRGRVHAALGKHMEAYEWQLRGQQLYKNQVEEEKKGLRFYEADLRNRLEDKQSAIMKLKESEIANTTLQLLAQTELLSELRADLLQIARKIPAMEPAARELRERVKNLPCQSIDWEKFDVQFKAAHPEFVKKLLERFPELTPMETRVCTLLRLNLKSHEIANMFCLEERSIETHRFNIRKKLTLETKQSLSNFLNAL